MAVEMTDLLGDATENRRHGRPTALIVEERDRGLIVVLDHAGVVLDRGRDREAMTLRVTRMLNTLPLCSDRPEGRVITGNGQRIVVLPSAAVMLTNVSPQLARHGLDVSSSLGWEVRDLDGAHLVTGPMDPPGGAMALVAAVAAACPAGLPRRTTLEHIESSLVGCRSAHRVVGPAKELRSVLLHIANASTGPSSGGAASGG